jgi:hypothetical protein
MHKNDQLNCRVCGYQSETPPWGDDGETPLYDYCPCCGVEHGYQDCQPSAARKYREGWIKSGAIWYEPRFKPADWVLENQLAEVPSEFR